MNSLAKFCGVIFFPISNLEFGKASIFQPPKLTEKKLDLLDSPNQPTFESLGEIWWVDLEAYVAAVHLEVGVGLGGSRAVTEGWLHSGIN